MEEIQLKIYFAAVCLIFLIVICLLNHNKSIKERQERRRLRRERQLKYNETRRLDKCLRRGELLPTQKHEKKQTVIIKGCFADKTEVTEE